MDLGDPNNVNQFDITSITVDETSSTISAECVRPDYGKVYVTFTLTANDESRTSGTLAGNGRGILDEDTAFSGRIQGVFKKRGVMISYFSRDQVSHGDNLFSDGTIDLSSNELAHQSFLFPKVFKGLVFWDLKL